jgi:hypothetical protein
MSFSFNELNLSGVAVNTGTFLQPGKYLARVKEAKVESTKSGGAKATIKFEEINGGGSITHWINLHLPGKDKATQIGREQFKSLLFFGGHPNPDKPEDINSVKGLVVGIQVRENKYTKDGVEKTGVEVGYVFDPAELDPVNYQPKTATEVSPSAGVQAAVGSDIKSDEIPF